MCHVWRLSSDGEMLQADCIVKGAGGCVGLCPEVVALHVLARRLRQLRAVRIVLQWVTCGRIFLPVISIVISYPALKSFFREKWNQTQEKWHQKLDFADLCFLDILRLLSWDALVDHFHRQLRFWMFPSFGWLLRVPCGLIILCEFHPDSSPRIWPKTAAHDTARLVVMYGNHWFLAGNMWCDWWSMVHSRQKPVYWDLVLSYGAALRPTYQSCSVSMLTSIWSRDQYSNDTP